MVFKKHIAEILKKHTDLYVYNDTSNGVVVIFKMPSVVYISKLYNLVANNIISSYDADDIVCEQCWVYSYGDRDKVDMAKASISNFIFILSIDADQTNMVVKFNAANQYYDTIKDVLIGIVVSEGLDIYTNVISYDAMTLYHTATLALGKKGITLTDFIKRVSGEDVPQMHKEELTSENYVKNTDFSASAPLHSPISDGEHVFRMAKSAEEARKMPEYSEIFSLLDKISDGTITERERARLNPRHAVGAGGVGEIVGDKVMSDEDFKPHKGKIVVKKR